MKSLEELLLERLEENNKNYTCREFAPIIQEWVISEFAPEVEKWVKEYLNNKQTSLHIADFCNDNESVPFEFENEQ